MGLFQQSKLYLVENLHLARDALHIYVALIIFVGACLMFGWKARDWLPWLLVLFVAAIGEALDIHERLEGFARPATWENLKDIVNTMILPTVLLLAARYSTIFVRGSSPAAENRGSGDEAEVAGTSASGERDLV